MEKIIFDEVGHTYTKAKTGIVVPSVNHILNEVYGTGLENAPSYYVERAANKGKERHTEIDDIIKGKKKKPEFAETTFFLKYAKDNKLNLKKALSEKILYASTPFGEVCGTADLIYNDLYDYKTSKTATKKQIDHWQMQLSFYYYMLKQNKIFVERMKVLHLTETSCKEIELPYLGDDFIEGTMKLFSEGKKATSSAFVNELQTVPNKEVEYFLYAVDQIATYEESIKAIKEAIKNEMEQRNILALKIGDIEISYIAPHKRKSFDSEKFKAEHSDLYNFYQKESTVKSSIRVKVKPNVR